MTYEICVIGGDGIGPEVTDCAEQVLRAAAASVSDGPRLRLRHASAGLDCYRRTGDPLPAQTLDAARAADGVLLGALDVAGVPAGVPNPLRGLRRGLELVASLRPSRSFPGVPRAVPGVDLLIVREITEGLYAGRERPLTEEPGAVAERVVTRRASLRTAEVAFRQARSRRGSVTAAHKIGALRLTDSVFLDAVAEVAERYPGVEYHTRNVDACALDLVQHPEQFDVIVTTNAFGDILSDVAAGVTGGIGLAASGCVGERWSYFEPAHGTAPRRAGQARANPVATVLSAAMLLRQLGQAETAEAVEQAVAAVLADGPRTSDLGGSAGSVEMTDAIVAALGVRAGTQGR
ncbi:isocitrate/isopropylmalate dehydrogenase family protein [Solwaraspora sp. WMMB335]|uniref:isocitrate/isopropylmalate dehydrogenase family protein n=1 Tax=Solwaraspora sp. WMMB335 TaxID=3404118 RepID=UPI003B926812